MVVDTDIAEQFERHLNSPKQTWLLGAGVSFPANIPLMFSLTDIVLKTVREQNFVDDDEANHVLEFITNDCGGKSHIEHHLTHLGDLISIAERSHTNGVDIGAKRIAKEKLVDIHRCLIEKIADTVRWGFRPARLDPAQEEQFGQAGASVVDISGHRKFVEAVFGPNRAGLDFVRSPVEFFTTNYDTLIEDSLALSGIEFQDGFIGGGVGFWSITNYQPLTATRAIVSKLHGSIDWYRPNSGGSMLLRVRNGDTYPDKGGAVMIYPQATKYLNTQRDPFAEIFQRFRARILQGSDHVLLICGYSFGDEHINAEIEIAMSSRNNQLTIVAFVDEPNDDLPPTIKSWLAGRWGQQLFVASPKGLYQGNSGPVFTLPNEKRDWWTFAGVSNLLSTGLPKDISGGNGMTAFLMDTDLEIGTVFEVAGNAIKIALKRDITELTRSHSGRVYDVGQIGSVLKMHLGRRIIFATVRLLRLQSDEETAALLASNGKIVDQDRRVIEADLLGEAWFNSTDNELSFKRGVSTYPLPLQAVHLLTKEEVDKLYASAEKASEDGTGSTGPIGAYVGATRVQCRANIDKLFGHHCAILGSTGSGKSSAVAAVIHSILEHQCQPERKTRPCIILIDPHGEYASAFNGRAKVYRAYNALGQNPDGISTLKLPYWLMSSDEFRSLIIGKTEFEATSQANTVYKALAHSRMVEAGLALSALGEVPNNMPAGHHPEEPMAMPGVDIENIISFDRDKPRPFKLSEFRAHIEGRQSKRPAKAGGWETVSASEYQKDYSSILNKFRVLTSDPRVGFLMEEYGANAPSLADILSQFLNVDGADDSCLKIIDISGLPNEIAGPLTGAIARLLFQYKLHQTREERESDPILFVCEEAHRYVPNKGDAQYEVAQTAVRRLAREGRKYGLGLMLVSQRPSDIEDTVISQCNSWIVLRLANSSDQEHVSRILPDSLTGMTKMLSSLPRQEALFVGEAAAIPARIRLRTLSRDQLPNSHDISFATGWSSEGTTTEGLTNVVARMTS